MVGGREGRTDSECSSVDVLDKVWSSVVIASMLGGGEGGREGGEGGSERASERVRDGRTDSECSSVDVLDEASTVGTV